MNLAIVNEVVAFADFTRSSSSPTTAALILIASPGATLAIAQLGEEIVDLVILHAVQRRLETDLLR